MLRIKARTIIHGSPPRFTSTFTLSSSATHKPRNRSHWRDRWMQGSSPTPALRAPARLPLPTATKRTDKTSALPNHCKLQIARTTSRSSSTPRFEQIRGRASFQNVFRIIICIARSHQVLTTYW